MSQAADDVKSEWVASQKKTFTKWMNNHLRKKNFSTMEDVQTEFEDGIKLMQIVNALYDVPIPKYNPTPKMRPHKLDNLALALDMVEVKAKIKTNFLKREHLIDHDLKMILGMLWAIILDYAIKGISVDELTAKEGLLLWCRKKTAGYRDVDPPGVQNFSTSWKDGMAFCALIHRHRPELIDYNSLEKGNHAANLELAFSVAEKHCDIPRLLDVEDLTGTERPDERSVMTYVSEFFHRFASQDLKENAARRVGKFLKFAKHMEEQQYEYETRARALIQWADQQAAAFAQADLGDTLDDAVNALGAFRHYVVNVKPSKAAEKLDVESLFAQIQTELLVNNRRPYQCNPEVGSDAVEAAFDRLAAAERARGQAVRANRFKFIRKEESGISQEKLHEFELSFKHFDKNGNGFLDKTEFKAALTELGVPFKDEAAFNKVFNDVGQGAANVNLEQYIKFNTQLHEDKDTPEQIKASFLMMTDNANTISESQLRMPPLTEEDAAYLKSKMPQTENGGYDFSALVDATFAS